MYGWDKRYSFNCADQGCRKRKTPASVRFLGRRVYAGVVVVLVCALRNGPTPERAEKLRLSLGVDLRTLNSWVKWWKDIFPISRFWKGEKDRLGVSDLERPLPQRLTKAFGADDVPGMVNLLRFLSPITVPGALEGLVM